MAFLSQAQINDVTKLAVTMFGAAPGQYQAYLQDVYAANGADMLATANEFATIPVFMSQYPGAADPAANSVELADQMMDTFGIDINATNTAGEPVGQWAFDSFKASFANGDSVPQVIVWTIDLLAADDNVNYAAQEALLNTKVAVANNFSNNEGANETNLGALQYVINQVDGTETVAENYGLTLGQDIFNADGSTTQKIFDAGLINNSETLQEGDVINGGANTADTLNVTVADNGFAIAPETNSVEILNVRSQADLGTASGDNEVEEGANTIDAQNMNGTNEFWSTNSRADLVIEDVRNDSTNTTIGWREADAGTDGQAVDYKVYFDHEHITDLGVDQQAADMTLRLDDLEADENGTGNGLESLPYQGINFQLGTDTPITLEIDFATLTGTKLEAFTALTAAINAELAANGITTVTATMGVIEAATATIGTNTYDGFLYPITFTNTGDEAMSIGGFDLKEGEQAPGARAESVTYGDASSLPSLTQTDVVLDYVGRGEKAGVLEIGNISNINNNTHAYSKGIEQFNVEVDRDSYFTTLKSTSNGVENVATSLEVINVENIAENSDGTGDLRIDGNRANDGTWTEAGINDVRVFDASEMQGDVNITAMLSSEIVAKYLELQDDQSDPTYDNSTISSDIPLSQNYQGVDSNIFFYDFGAGNDSLDMRISDANLAAAGTTTREDFVLAINGNDGNDELTFSIRDDAGNLADDLDGTANWYLNHQTNGNITITGGDGEDTIWTPGAGDLVINGNDGDDTIYSDNAGIMLQSATWLVNSDGTNINIDDINGARVADLDGTLAGNQSTTFLVNGKLTVTLSDSASAIAAAGTVGYEVTVDVPTGNNYAVTQTHINQAIKEAINGDDVLNKLFKAEDGPGVSLVITSLIDGVFTADDILLEVSSADVSGASYTTAQQTQITQAWENYSGLSGQSIAIAQAANAQSVIDVNGLSGMTTNQVLAQTSVTDITYTISTAAGQVSIDVDGTIYTYDYAAAEAINVMADNTAAMLVANGVVAVSDGIDTVTVYASGVTATETGAGDAGITAAAGTDADLTGVASTYASDNVITGGADDDVIVLSTTDDGATTAGSSNETVVFSGTDFGDDTVVNFTLTATSATGADQLDMTAYFGGLTVTSTNVSVQTNDLAIVNNEISVIDFTTLNAFVNPSTGNNYTFDEVAALSGSALTTYLNNAVNTVVDNADALLMIQNMGNEGEYAVIDATGSSAATANTFSSATVVGTIDFGYDLTTNIAAADFV